MNHVDLKEYLTSLSSVSVLQRCLKYFSNPAILYQFRNSNFLGIYEILSWIFDETEIIGEWLSTRQIRQFFPPPTCTVSSTRAWRYSYQYISYNYTIYWFDGIIKTHDSESRGQEEAGRTQRTSELFTCTTALKFVNALNKPP